MSDDICTQVLPSRRGKRPRGEDAPPSPMATLPGHMRAGLEAAIAAAMSCLERSLAITPERLRELGELDAIIASPVQLVFSKNPKHADIYHRLRAHVVAAGQLGNRSSHALWGPSSSGKRRLMRLVAIAMRHVPNTMVVELDGNILVDDDDALHCLVSEIGTFLSSPSSAELRRRFKGLRKLGTSPTIDTLVLLGEAVSNGLVTAEQCMETPESPDEVLDAQSNAALSPGALGYLQNALVYMNQIGVSIVILVRNMTQFGIWCDRVTYVLSGLMHECKPFVSDNHVSPGGVSLVVCSTTPDLALEKRLSSRLSCEMWFCPHIQWNPLEVFFALFDNTALSLVPAVASSSSSSRGLGGVELSKVHSAVTAFLHAKLQQLERTFVKQYRRVSAEDTRRSKRKGVSPQTFETLFQSGALSADMNLPLSQEMDDVRVALSMAELLHVGIHRKKTEKDGAVLAPSDRATMMLTQRTPFRWDHTHVEAVRALLGPVYKEATPRLTAMHFLDASIEQRLQYTMELLTVAMPRALAPLFEDEQAPNGFFTLVSSPQLDLLDSRQLITMGYACFEHIALLAMVFIRSESGRKRNLRDLQEDIFNTLQEHASSRVGQSREVRDAGVRDAYSDLLELGILEEDGSGDVVVCGPHCRVQNFLRWVLNNADVCLELGMDAVSQQRLAQMVR